MTRVLIVDDEVVFRNNIKSILDWDEYGFELCGEASDVISAKHEIEEAEPDIVITDVKMPGISGLSLITFLNENYPHIQVIALSGYDDYEYVRTSMKNGVVDYLLKHNITGSSLLNALKTAQKQICMNREINKDNERIKNQIAFGKKMMQQRFLNDLLEGKIKNLQEIISKSKELSLPMCFDNIVVVVAEIDNMSSLKNKNTQGEWQSLFEKISELIRENLTDGAMLVPRFYSGFVILFSTEKTHSQNTFFRVIMDCISQIRIALKRHYNITACYSVSGCASSPVNIGELYEKACSALGERIYRENDITIHDCTIPKSAYRSYDIDFHDEHNIIRLLKSHSWKGVKEYIENIFSNIRDCELDSVHVQLIFAHLINLLSRTLREYNADLKVVYPDFYSVFQNIHHMSLNEMQQGVLDCYFSTLQYLKRFGAMEKYHEVTRNAIIYINRNYHKDISLNAIAEDTHTSASYLSRLFKEDTGSGVVEYLNRIRVEHAKQLIRNGVKNNELYKLSGFNSNTYFYMVFKNITGKTPNEFREDLLQPII
ncbi:MAG: response regulator [Bacteroidales bacterium]|nr:response regulator [Bacteroidales bacterium]